MNHDIKRPLTLAAAVAVPMLAAAMLVAPSTAKADPRISVNLGIPLGAPVYVQPYAYYPSYPVRVVYRPAPYLTAYYPGPRTAYRPAPRPWRYGWNRNPGHDGHHRH